MSEKNISRIRRAKKSRIHIRDQESPRLTVFRSSKHFYAQIFDSLGAKVIVSASTVEKDLKIDANNVAGAKEVGKRVAERQLKANSNVQYKCIKSLAETEIYLGQKSIKKLILDQ